MKKEEGNFKALLAKRQNVIIIYAFRENTDVSLSIIIAAANNQVKQQIRVIMFLEGKGYFSQDIVPNP